MSIKTRIIDYYLTFLHQFQPRRTVKILGRKFIVCPKVFSPTGVVSTSFFIKHMRIKETDVVAEIGCGAGVLSVFAALKARKVFATDINPYAVKCTKINAEINFVNVHVKLGDLFTPLPSKLRFTVVITNPPYLPLRPLTLLEKAWCGGEKLNFLEKFFKEAPKHLSKNGNIQFTASTLSGIERVKELLRKRNFSYSIIAKTKTPIDEIYFFKAWRK